MLLTLFASVFALVNPLQTVSALSGAEFEAGHIIDDAVFYNKTTMNADQIQQFLNSRVPTCDSAGIAPSRGSTVAARGIAQGSPPPYTCLKDFREDTVAKPAEPGLCNGYDHVNQTAAQIIYGVAQSCGINPQVLLVLLQKEQGLVDDTSPWLFQYRSATGYGCPDFAPCDAQFFGFFNQVYSAARQFKRYALFPGDYGYRAGRTNIIQFNPEAACGTTPVYIQNQATASLYNYTPYPPNLAARANLYGEGDMCSAYGNRNFWREFNDWFGSPYVQPKWLPTPKPPLPILSVPLTTGLMESRSPLYSLYF